MSPGTRLGWSFVGCSVDSQLNQEEEHFEMVQILELSFSVCYR